MLVWLPDIPAGVTLPLFFPSYDTAGGSVTLTGLAATDIEIYKGTSMTQRASDNGYALVDTDGIDIDSRTGIHGFSIDLADNSDAGFYAAGSFYHVVVDAVTIDSQTVRFIFAFRIVAAESTAGTPKADVSMFGGTAGTFSSGRPEVNTTHLGGSTTPITNLGTVFNTDFAANYNTTLDQWNVNVESWNATAVPAEHTAGYPIVTVKDGTGTGEINTNAGAIALVDLVATVTTLTNDPTGVSTLLTRLGTPSNLGGGATVAANLSDIEAQTDDIGTAGAGLTAIGDTRLANLDATVSSRATPAQVNTEADTALSDAGVTSARQAKLDEVTAARMGALTDWINGGRLDLILDAILAMSDDPRGEPGQGAPPVNPDAMTKLDYLYKAWRNKKTQTSSEQKLFADDATTVDQKVAVSDDATTLTIGEVAAGP